jgi:acyl-coenzyme A thioesterase PaaI-like protein
MNTVRIAGRLSGQIMAEQQQHAQQQQAHHPVVVEAGQDADAASRAQPRLELPHTRGCFVCDRDNAQGLHLASFVDPATGHVTIDFTPRREHAGFDGVVHGGVTSSVVDEAMTWAATWRARKFCVCGELTVRFRGQMKPAETYHVEALVDFSRPNMVETSAKITDARGRLVVTASAKYMVMSLNEHEAAVGTLVREPSTGEATRLLGF